MDRDKKLLHLLVRYISISTILKFKNQLCLSQHTKVTWYDWGREVVYKYKKKWIPLTTSWKKNIPDPLRVLASCSDMRASWPLLLDLEVCRRVFRHHFEVCKKVYLHQRAFFPHRQKEGDSINEGTPKVHQNSPFNPPEWVMFSVTSGSLATGWHLHHLLHLKVFLFLEVCRMAFSHLHHPEACRKASSELERCKRVCLYHQAYRMVFYQHHYFQKAK